MKFSIIIPAYNEEKYITPCLKSVSALKVPADASFEVIVVNNASTDRTAEVASAVLPRAVIIDEPRKGLTTAYNRGAREARGEILVFIDADMIPPQNHLEKIYREFAKDAELVAVSGPYIYRDGGKPLELALRFIYLFFAMPAEIVLNRWLNLGASLASGNSAIKKDAFDKVKGFNENIFWGLEPEFTMRIRKIGKVRFRYGLGAESSTRRFKGEGFFLTIGRYIINIVWPYFFKKSFTKICNDIR